jgi:predicted RNA-binding Zn ribbon-like protein
MGRPRSFLPVDRMPLVGGAPCLDLVNTSGGRAGGAPRERLLAWADLVVWGARAGLLDRPAAAALRRWGSRHPRLAERLLGRVRRLREDLYKVLLAIAEGRDLAPESLSHLNVLWRAERSRRELVRGRQGLEWRLRPQVPADRLFWPLLTSAVELLTSGRAALIRQCRECDWLFMDTSKNGSRTWCKAQCGNRARARRHYRAASN